jgi:membrane-bound serine protease (ClpP class)
MEQYLTRGVAVAEQTDAELIIFQINTPGGEIELMNRMVQLIRGSRIPVVVYVAPRGAMAASAGSLITLAGHVAAMAPETIIGAASPVGTQGEDIGETMETKAKEALMATVRSITANRPPEAVKVAQEMVNSAKALSAEEALQIGLVDIIADSPEDLLSQLNGRTVLVQDSPVVLQTEGLVTRELPTSFIEQLLGTLTNPNIVFLLLTIGVQAILIELSSPGGWVAGFIGIVSLALAVYGLGILPVNWFGILFVLMAFVLFIIEIKSPVHGALTVAGTASFIVGALVLFNSATVPSFFRVNVPLVIGTAIVTAGTFLVIVGFAIRAQRTPIRMGRESLAGRVGVVRERLSPEGSVQMEGELWTAESDDGSTIEVGGRVVVVRVQGLKLIVHQQQTT